MSGFVIYSLDSCRTLFNVLYIHLQHIEEYTNSVGTFTSHNEVFIVFYFLVP